MVVFVAVRPSVSLKEACGAQLHLTHRTHKVFRVPHFTQCCDHLEKGNVSERGNKRFWSLSSCLNFHNLVPVWQILFFVSCRSRLYLSYNAFVAGSTVALGCGPYTNLLQVSAQPSQQVIYHIRFLSLRCGFSIWSRWSVAAAAARLFSTFCLLFLCKWWRVSWRF